MEANGLAGAVELSHARYTATYQLPREGGLKVQRADFGHDDFGKMVALENIPLGSQDYRNLLIAANSREIKDNGGPDTPLFSHLNLEGVVGVAIIAAIREEDLMQHYFVRTDLVPFVTMADMEKLGQVVHDLCVMRQEGIGSSYEDSRILPAKRYEDHIKDIDLKGLVNYYAHLKDMGSNYRLERLKIFTNSLSGDYCQNVCELLQKEDMGILTAIMFGLVNAELVNQDMRKLFPVKKSDSPHVVDHIEKLNKHLLASELYTFPLVRKIFLKIAADHLNIRKTTI